MKPAEPPPRFALAPMFPYKVCDGRPFAAGKRLRRTGVAMGRLTTHVLDTASGRPAAGLTIELYRLSNHEMETEVATSLFPQRADQAERSLA